MVTPTLNSVLKPYFEDSYYTSQLCSKKKRLAREIFETPTVQILIISWQENTSICIADDLLNSPKIFLVT